MNQLGFETCVSLNKNSLALSPSEIKQLHQSLPDWTITEINGIPCLQKTFNFENFNAALSFTNRIGQQAEDQNHHPTILTEWGKVTVTWWTHIVKGLHRNDFIMAARTDSVYEFFFNS